MGPGRNLKLAAPVVEYGGRTWRLETAGMHPVAIRSQPVVERANVGHFGFGCQPGLVVDHGEEKLHAQSSPAERRILPMAANPDRASYFPAIEKKYGQPMSYWFDQMAQISDRKYAEQIAFLKENHGFSQAHANALVMYSRGSTSAHRVATLDGYLEPCDETKRTTVRAILKAITSKYPKAETVIAWYQPMVKIDGHYVFGLSVLTNYILIAPWGTDVLERFRPRLTDYKVNKKTIQVPVDWKPDVALLRDMVAARIAENSG